MRVSVGIVVTITFLVCALSRLVLVHEGLPYVDRLFVPDDTYYTLEISHSLSQGRHPSADRTTPTSGFQPMLAGLQVPLHWLLNDKDEVLIAATMLSALIGALSVLPLAVILSYAGNTAATVTGTIVWCIASPILKNDLNGLDTSLSGLMALLVLAATIRVEARKYRTSDAILLGCLIGFSLLARIDNCFLAIAVGCFGIIKWPPKTVAAIVGAATLVMLPWWAYLMMNFGSIVPESGPALRQIVEYHFSRDFLIRDSIALTAQALSSISGLRNLPDISALAIVVFISATSAYASYLICRERRYILWIAGAAAILLIIFYTFYLPAFWFFERYYYFIFIYFVLGLSTMVGILWRKRQVLPTSIKAGALAFATIAFCAHIMHYLTYLSKPPATIDSGIAGAKGYGEVAKELLSLLPSGAKLATFQSGALGYYAPPSISVINLDGVTNKAAFRALRERKLGEYATSAGMTHFADWSWNIELLDASSAHRNFSNCFDAYYSSKRQGADQFTLFDTRHCRLFE